MSLDVVVFGNLVSFVTNLVGRNLYTDEVDKLKFAQENATDAATKVSLGTLFDALANDRKIDAIREYRRLTGSSLKESKDAVENLVEAIRSEVLVRVNNNN